MGEFVQSSKPWELLVEGFLLVFCCYALCSYPVYHKLEAFQGIASYLHGTA